MEPAGKRFLVDALSAAWKVSISKACDGLNVDSSLYYYKSGRGKRADLKRRIRGICVTRVRVSYRAAAAYAAERRVSAKLRDDPMTATSINQVCACALSACDRGKVRLPTIVATFSLHSSG